MLGLFVQIPLLANSERWEIASLWQSTVLLQTVWFAFLQSLLFVTFELISWDLVASFVFSMLLVYKTDTDSSSSFLMTHYLWCLAISACSLAMVAGNCFNAVANIVVAIQEATSTR